MRPFFSLKSAIRPPHTHLIQTDGSFKSGISRTACVFPLTKEYMLCTYIDHRHSGDSEWCSVLDGIRFAKKLDRGAIHLENDNQGLINALINRRPPRHMDYYDAITDEIRHLDYIGIRWIPRGLNRADGLFDKTF
uniref:RNase H type-1 domain-containing protein n=1 Tax=viral metagenome TaxID=1070528 RepID=A0A6C0E654_9ZZZZ